MTPSSLAYNTINFPSGSVDHYTFHTQSYAMYCFELVDRLLSSLVCCRGRTQEGNVPGECVDGAGCGTPVGAGESTIPKKESRTKLTELSRRVKPYRHKVRG